MALAKVKMRIARQGGKSVDAPFFQRDVMGAHIPLFKYEDADSRLTGDLDGVSVIRTAIAKQKKLIYPLIGNHLRQKLWPGFYSSEVVDHVLATRIKPVAAVEINLPHV